MISHWQLLRVHVTLGQGRIRPFLTLRKMERLVGDDSFFPLNLGGSDPGSCCDHHGHLRTLNRHQHVRGSTFSEWQGDAGRCAV